MATTTSVYLGQPHQNKNKKNYPTPPTNPKQGTNPPFTNSTISFTPSSPQPHLRPVNESEKRSRDPTAHLPTRRQKSTHYMLPSRLSLPAPATGAAFTTKRSILTTPCSFLVRSFSVRSKKKKKRQKKLKPTSFLGPPSPPATAPHTK